MAPFSAMSDVTDHHQESVRNEKRDFSSIIDFIGANDNSKIKKRRRGDAEKKRRDRINKCLDQLEDLIPYVKQKKLCSKVDKAEVLELTVKYIKESIFGRDTLRSNLSMTSYDYKPWSDVRKHSTGPRWHENIHTVSEHHLKSELCRCGCGRLGDTKPMTSSIRKSDMHMHSRILLPSSRTSPEPLSMYPHSSSEHLSPGGSMLARSPASMTTPSSSSPISHKIDFLLKNYEKNKF